MDRGALRAPWGSQKVGHDWATFTFTISHWHCLFLLSYSATCFDKYFNILVGKYPVYFCSVAKSCLTVCDSMDNLSLKMLQLMLNRKTKQLARE